VVIGHLHLDHAGGLMHFKDTDVPIWVHKLELENAFYSCATGADDAVYQAHYLLPKAFNWKTFDDRTVDFAPGLTLHHLPGHTVGLCGLQINLINDGTFIFVSECVHLGCACAALELTRSRPTAMVMSRCEQPRSTLVRF
jgi:glyoxylase-like metal-dependent hydrolase (beta-lactamase superfamily II)